MYIIIMFIAIHQLFVEQHRNQLEAALLHAKEQGDSDDDDDDNDDDDIAKLSSPHPSSSTTTCISISP